MDNSIIAYVYNREYMELLTEVILYLEDEADWNRTLARLAMKNDSLSLAERGALSRKHRRIAAHYDARAQAISEMDVMQFAAWTRQYEMAEVA